MKRVFLGIFLIILLITTGCTKSSSVVATVNDMEISKEEFDKQMVLTEISYGINGYTFPESGEELESIKEEMLVNVAESYMLVDLAKKKGIEIDEDTAKTQSEELITFVISLYGSEEKYEEFLKEKDQKRKDFDAYLLELARSNEYMYNLYDEITKDISVTSDEVKEYYQENSKNYDYSTVSVMSIQVEDEKTANSIYTDITNNKVEFEEAMVENEEKDGVLSVSDLGAIYYGSNEKEFSEIAFAMEVGEISEPFKSGDSYFVIYLYNKDEQEPMAYDEIKDTVEADLLTQKKSTVYEEYVKTEKEAYTITIGN